MEVPLSYHVSDVADGTSPCKHSDHDDGGQPEGPVEPPTKESKRPHPKVRQSHLELEWVVFGPSDVCGNLIAEEKMAYGKAEHLVAEGVDKEIFQNDGSPEPGRRVLKEILDAEENAQCGWDEYPVSNQQAFHSSQWSKK